MSPCHIEWLAERFEENRTHLRAVAYRMLGPLSEADDAVQEAWLRLSRSNTSGVENLRGWLTTVVAHDHAIVGGLCPGDEAGGFQPLTCALQ